ncbi:MAG TPA: cell cycle transcriptional regulator TrcR [Caulobacter sp.]|nr:cell cycle transcriptional regulator TrcR [Caulobacter sp.]
MSQPKPYDPNAMLDTILAKLQLRNDAALSRLLEIQAPVISKIGNGQLTREELDRAQANDAYRMKAQVSRHAELLKPQKKAPRYTPVSRRQDRPDAIAWFLRHHPEVTDAQISKLLGTTKSTIEQVRARTHWNAANIKPVDPVTLGLVGQLELDALVKKAAEKKAKDDLKKGILPEDPTLRPASETSALPEDHEDEEAAIRAARIEPKAEDVFGKSTYVADDEEDDED